MADISASVSELSSEEKRALLAQLLARKAGKSPAPALPTIVPAPDERYQPFPLTDVQQAYWIGRGDLLELGNIACHVYFEVDVANLDVDRWDAAWLRLIERHDMLRAIIRPDGQQQVLEHVPPYHFPLLDLRGRAPEVVAAQLEAVREELSHQVLPADRWPLFNVRASLLDERRIRLHISADLMIVDFGSFQILLKEWFQLYLHPEASLPPLEITFRDYVLAEAALRDSDLYRRSWEYWWQRIPTLPPGPELPLAKSPAAVTRPRFVRRTAKLEPDAWRRLKTRATRSGLTLSGTMLAAFSEVLATWSKSPRFTLNLTLFQRLPLHPQVKDLIGDFTSLSFLEVDYSGPDSFLARATRLQQRLWQDLDHRYVSGVRVLRELARAQGGVPSAVAPVVFTSLLVEDMAIQDAVTLAVLGEVVYGVSQTPQVTLDHQVFEEAGGLTYNWDALEELFPAGLLDAMFDAYGRLLRRLADDEQAWERPVDGLVPPAQLAQRRAINATEAPVPTELLHTLFAARAARQPDRPAVITPDRTLTYGELARRSVAAGRRLRALGARPNALVAIVMDKGWEQVVAALGIVQSGAAYLPIDPDLPRERRWYLLEHGQVELALTQARLDAELEWPPGVERLRVDDDAAWDFDGPPLEPLQGPEDLAYVIYTSGSTGLPKGVMIDHRGAVNTIVDLNARFGVSPADRVLGLSALSFDLSVYDIFGLLAAGGTLVPPDPAGARDPAHWAELLRRERVTIWNTVPALLQMLVDYAAGRPDVLPDSLRLAWLSGDWIPVSLPDQLRALVPTVRAISMGGATEASIWSILYPIEQVDPAWRSIPYGKPMLNQTFHVLDEALEPRPVWVPGDLYIGGLGLAKGYWRDEEKTRASFFIHPRTGQRLYRTGDLGRYLPDGNIEFLGREDFQVKIQGFRIELGEVEAALEQHPAVRTAVVTAVGEPRGRKRLVAYVVPEQEHVVGNDQSGLDLTRWQQSLEFIAGYLEGVTILDPFERLEFSLGRPGLRPDADGRSIELARPELDDTLKARYAERRSERVFLAEPIPLERLSQLLDCLAAIDIDGVPKYRYPSADGLYPVQAYLHVKPGRVEGLPAGTYYYHPRDHRLVLLSDGARIEPEVHWPHNRAAFDESAFSLFLIARLGAIAPLYGNLARDFCLLEAGYMGQLLMEVAPASEIGLCPIGDLQFDQLRPLFALDDDHLLVHSLLGGTPDPARARGRPRLEHPAERAASEGRADGRSSGDSAIVSELRDFLRQKLPEYMVPSAFVLLDGLPLTPNGKVDRKALPAPEQASPEAEGAYQAPRTPTEKRLADLWAGVLGLERVGIHDNFFEVGGDSLLAVQLIAQATEAGLELDPRELFQNQTIAELAALIDRAPSAANGHTPAAVAPARPALPSALVEIQPGSDPSLFWVHPSSGNVECYYELVRQLGLDQAVYGLQAPGLDGEEVPHTRIEPMAAHYVELLKLVQPDGPYLLGGWSMGGLVAFEMARQLRAQGQQVDLLALLDIGVADFRRQDDTEDDGELLAGILGDHIPVSLEEFRRLEPDEQLRFVLDQAKAARLAPPSLELSELMPYVTLTQANLRAARDYRPQAYPGRVALFRAAERPPQQTSDPHLGWDELALGGVEAYVTPGHHFTLLREPNVRVLAEQLGACLARSRSSDGSWPEAWAGTGGPASSATAEAAAPDKPAIWGALLEAGRRQAAQLPPDLDSAAFESQVRLLNRLGTGYICRTLLELGAFRQAGEQHTFVALVERLRIAPTYPKLLRRWLDILADEGLLERSGDLYAAHRPLPTFSPDALWSELVESRSWPAEVVEVLRRGSENLGAVVAGELSPLALLFSSGSSDLAEYLYQHGPVARYCNAIAGAIVRELEHFWPVGRPLRVLEVGAGTGATTASLLPELPPDITTYTFTDLSKYFTIMAEKKFEAFPFVRYGLLNVEQDPRGQGYAAEGFDLLVAANVLHGTRDAREAVKHLRQLLAPGGLCLIWEATRQERWYNIALALIEGWWRFEDERLRENYPLLSPAGWEAVLRSAGFVDFAAFPEPGAPTELFGQHIMLGRAGT